jgi:hypothetical protein
VTFIFYVLEAPSYLSHVIIMIMYILDENLSYTKQLVTIVDKKVR